MYPIRIDSIPEPKIEEPKVIIIKVIPAAICGYKLHLYGSQVPIMKEGAILGHESLAVG